MGAIMHTNRSGLLGMHFCCYLFVLPRVTGGIKGGEALPAIQMDILRYEYGSWPT